MIYFDTSCCNIRKRVWSGKSPGGVQQLYKFNSHYHIIWRMKK